MTMNFVTNMNELLSEGRSILRTQGFLGVGNYQPFKTAEYS